MKKNKENKSLKYHLLLIAFLCLFSLFLIIFTSTIYVTQNYQYYTGTLEQKEFRELEVGRVVLENTGLLPAKVPLKNFVLCQDDEAFTSQIYYRGGAQLSQGDPFQSSNGFFLELSPGEQRKLSLIYPGSFPKLENNDSETLTFYLYELLDSEEFYNYELCYELRESEREPLTSFTLLR